MKTIKATKKLIKELKQVKDKNEINDVYYHLGTMGDFYIFELNTDSIQHIDYFINKNLIYVRQD